MDIDSIFITNNCLGTSPVEVVGHTSCLDTIGSIASIVIAIINVVLVVYIFCKEREDNKKADVNNKKFELLHSLILNQNVAKLYSFIQNVRDKAKELQNIQIGDEENKSLVNQAILDYQSKFRIEFLLLFSVISDSLYKALVEATDIMTDKITKAIFDDGLNLCSLNKYNEVIEGPITDCQKQLLQLIYNTPNKYL